MKAVIALALREFKSALVTPAAYILAASFLLISGFFFFTLLQQFNIFLPQAALLAEIRPSLNEWVAMPFYTTLAVLLIFFIPVLVMGTIAEERKKGTIELLFTAALSSSQIVLGKLLGAFMLVSSLIVVVLIFPAVLIIFSDPEVLPVIIGALGLLILACSYAAICLAISACTANQAVAAVIGIVVLTILSVINIPATRFAGLLTDILNYLSPMQQAAGFFKGTIESGQIIYFLSLILLGFFFANRVLDTERWR